MSEPSTSKSFFESAALMLTVLNGWMLFKTYLRDRPILNTRPVHPDIYQWYFKHPVPGGQGLKYGFLVYVDVINRGLRDVALESWTLNLRLTNGRNVPLRPYGISEPCLPIGDSGNVKVLPVLAIKGLMHQSSSLVKSGQSISGVAYYMIELPPGVDVVKKKSGTIACRFKVKSVLNNRGSCGIVLNEKRFNDIRELVQGIENVR